MIAATVDVTIDKPRQLRFTLLALGELELKSGKHLGWFVNELASQRCGPAVAVWLLWAGLLHDNPRLAVEAAEAILEPWVQAGHRLHELTEPLVIALDRSGLFGKPDEKNAPAEATASPSSTSALPSGSTS